MKADSRSLKYEVVLYALNNGYQYKTIEEKKRLVIEGLWKYTFNKAIELDCELENLENLKIDNLFRAIDGKIDDKKQKAAFFNGYTYLIKFFAFEMQGYKIEWNPLDQPQLVENPRMLFIDDRWAALLTHKNTPPVITAIKTINVFQNHFLEKGKALVKKQN